MLALTLTGCGGFDATPVNFSQEDIVTVGAIQTIEIRERVLASLPESAPQVNTQQAELGRLLFWDPILSGDRDVACATCHLPEAGYTDGQHQAIGVGGMGRGEERTIGHTGRVPRNSQTVLNTAWNGINELGLFEPTTAPMFWDSRKESLESQALEPIRSRQEMRGDNFSENGIDAEIAGRLNRIPAYQQAFSDAFGTESITITDVARALASFQRTLVANQTPFDRWMRGEANAMTNRQISGMQEFVIAGCADCHSGPLFSDFEPHVLGVREGTDVAEPDSGDGNFAFRTPTLRQLSLTAPYFHAGQRATLGSALDFYDEPRSSNNPDVSSSDLDPELLEVPEMDDGRGAIIQDFLETLNDDSFDKLVPAAVPSGLPPGGFDSGTPVS
ncbi:hypothetical protein AB833_32090 [Chromatiales bacterium (ex Bugula neritina AB1)]|nr:hypothetical protein AB833_32090 [Chromatiales bacterium (ex Bugula neritina AB1)]